MTDKIYYDSFTNEYCSEEDLETIAPPERYLPTFRGDEVYVEVYEAEGLRLDIAYTEFDIQEGMVNRVRFAVARRHGFPLNIANMVRWTIPSKKFDEYYKRFIARGEDKE